MGVVMLQVSGAIKPPPFAFHVDLLPTEFIFRMTRGKTWKRALAGHGQRSTPFEDSGTCHPPDSGTCHPPDEASERKP
jgi:hypothetical protein